MHFYLEAYKDTHGASSQYLYHRNTVAFRKTTQKTHVSHVFVIFFNRNKRMSAKGNVGTLLLGENWEWNYFSRKSNRTWP